MIDVVGIVFKENSRVYYFSPENFNIKKDMKVIVETERGLQFGIAVTDVFKIKRENLNLPLKNVIRIADSKDESIYEKNLADSKEAIEQCNKLINKYNLDMLLIDASFTFDRNQLIFHFTSDDRVDFRKLARDLASIYKTRIELRQIGVRDKAKEIGGLGPCGMALCCSSFLKSFDTVSINMAKTQNLALNPNKINGSCGRLLCCLSYENDLYQENRIGMPENGSIVKIKNGEGKVISIDILNRSYRVVNQNNEVDTINLD
jgi:cell fate regulator YaaT (PSP1 superfamily)